MKQLIWILGMSMGSICVQAQPVSVKCVVKDVYFAQAIPEATILVNGKDTLTADENGEFPLLLRNGSTEIVNVSAKGYLSADIKVTNTFKTFIIFLEPHNYQANSQQVRGLYNGKSLLQTPGSIASLTAHDFDRNNQIGLQHSFNLLPGVRMEFRNINTGARIILRGYGNQNNNNGIGYKAYYNDIPLTDADGTTNLDEVDFATLGRIEVFRGPVSSVYGTGIGGVVNMFSEKAPQGVSVGTSGLIGSNNLLRKTASIGVGNEKANVQLNYGQQKTDGYRMNANSQKDFWNLNADRKSVV